MCYTPLMNILQHIRETHNDMPDGEIAAHIYRVTGVLYGTSYIGQMRRGDHPISRNVQAMVEKTFSEAVERIL